MNIRIARQEDLPILLEIYAEARNYMRQNGNLHQWAGGYPSEKLVREDITKEICHVCEDEGEIVGVFVFFEGEEPTYRCIYDGAWLNDRPYGVIHRIAVARHRRGVASFCFDHAFSMCENVKIDTHRDNLPMQKSLVKNGFVRCGVIYLEDGAERIAFQKTRS